MNVILGKLNLLEEDIRNEEIQMIHEHFEPFCSNTSFKAAQDVEWSKPLEQDSLMVQLTQSDKTALGQPQAKVHYTPNPSQPKFSNSSQTSFTQNTQRNVPLSSTAAKKRQLERILGEANVTYSKIQKLHNNTAGSQVSQSTLQSQSFKNLTNTLHSIVDEIDEKDLELDE